MPKKMPKSDVAQRDFQEQKNHQDFVYETNTQIQALNHAVSALSLLIEKLRAKSESDHKALLIEFENFKDSVVPRCQNVEARIGDLWTNLQAHFQRVKKDHDNLSTTKIDTDAVMFYLEQHLRKIDANTESIKACKADLHGAIAGVVATNIRSLSTQRLELLDLILRPDPFKAEIEEKIRVFREDFDSLFKETTNLKLAFGCVQKKFEHALRVEKQQEVNQ